MGSLEEAVYALRAVLLGLESAPVAQLDRAAASEAVGQTFESSRAHHTHFSARESPGREAYSP